MHDIKNPLVSVIVPNYNYAKYLPLRIETIIKQSFNDFELILLDDASSDDSVKILRLYQEVDKRVSCVMVNDYNSGSPFKQWQKGIELARGKYIWIAESDDYADFSFLAKTVSLMEQHPTAAYCFTGSYIVDEVGNMLDKDMDRWTKKLQNNLTKYKLYSLTNYAAKNLYWTNYVYNASGVLFRKSSSLKIFNTRWAAMRYCGDWWFWTFMALQGDVIEVYERLNNFRQHSQSVTIDSKQDDEAYGACIKECIDLTWTLENYLPLSIYKRLLCYGNYYKDIKRKNIRNEIKQNLLNELEERCYMIKTAYYLERVNKALSGVFPFLCRIKTERCC